MIKKSLCVLSLTTFMMADTTMCFKKDWFDPSTIETTLLDGGKCAGSKSLIDMKDDGWSVEDIKISSGDNGMNFIYVLKKGGSVVVNNGVGISSVELKAQLKEIREEEIAVKKEKEKLDDMAVGKKIYNLHCTKCHGKNAEEEAYNVARSLNSLTLDDMQISIRDYMLDKRNSSTAMIMKPYAEIITNSDIERIYKYIQTLKSK